MTETQSRIQTGMGRVEYFAHKENIHELLKQGYTLTSIYAKLKKEGKLTLAYSTLTGLIKPHKRKSRKKTEIKNSNVETLPAVIIHDGKEKQLQIIDASKSSEISKNFDAETKFPKIIRSEKPRFGDRDNDSSFDSDNKY